MYIQNQGIKIDFCELLSHWQVVRGLLSCTDDQRRIMAVLERFPDCRSYCWISYQERGYVDYTGVALLLCGCVCEQTDD